MDAIRIDRHRTVLAERDAQHAMVRLAHGGQRSFLIVPPVTRGGTCSAKMGIVTASIISAVRSVSRSISLVTTTPCSRAARAARIAAF